MTVRIVCGIDFSETSRGALDEAAKLTRLLGAELHVVHAYGLPMAALPIDGGMMTGPERAADLASHADEQLQIWEQAYPDIDLVRHVVVGMPADEVLRVAEESDAAYIVVGTHGRSGLAHLLLGSVAENVMRHSKVPVLVVHRK
jgi:nucleotide-binding universal stress UspA family protein